MLEQHNGKQRAFTAVEGIHCLHTLIGIGILFERPVYELDIVVLSLPSREDCSTVGQLRSIRVFRLLFVRHNFG